MPKKQTRLTVPTHSDTVARMPDKDSPIAARIKELEAHIERRKGQIKDAASIPEKERRDNTVERQKREIAAHEAQIADIRKAK